MKKDKKNFKIMMLIAVNLAMLILISDFCTLRSYALNLGASGERVAAIQKSLKNAGYYSGEINGLYDFTTRRAVKKYRISNKIDGESDYDIISALGINSKGYKCYSSEVELLAKYLKANGIIEYHSMVEICEDILEKSKNDSLFGYIMDEIDNADKLINAQPNSEQYTAALQVIRRNENY